MKAQKKLFICLDNDDINNAQKNMGPSDRILTLKDSVKFCNSQPLVAEDFDANFNIEHFPERLKFMNSSFRHNINMVQIFGFYHVNMFINAIIKNISDFDTLEINETEKKYTGPVYFNSSFEGGEIGRANIKKYLLPVLKEKFNDKINSSDIENSVRQNNLKLLKIFILKSLYLLGLSLRSYLLKDVIKKVKPNTKIGFYRANSQLSIFNLMKNGDYLLIKIPVVRELLKKSSLNNSTKLSLLDFIIGFKEWAMQYKKCKKIFIENKNSKLYKQIFYETYIASLENYILERWTNKILYSLKNHGISKLANLEFRSPQASVFYHCAKKNNFYVEQFLTMDIFDMKLDIPYKKFGDVLITPSSFYCKKFNDINETKVFSHEIFTKVILDNVNRNIERKYFSSIYLVLKIDITEYQSLLIKKIIDYCETNYLNCTVRPHPRGLPKQLKFLKKTNVKFCNKEWNNLILEKDELIVSFYSAALFEILFYSHKFLLVDEGKSSFAGVDLTSRMFQSVDELDKFTKNKIEH